MKVSRIIIVLWILVITVLPLTAQDAEESGDASKDKNSSLYYVSVPVRKVFPYRNGYVVDYVKSGPNGTVRAYLPQEWFTTTGGKGDLIMLNPGSTWPALTVYYKDGAFDHVRLYVRRDKRHETWGQIPPGVNLDSNFENVEDIKLEF